MPDGSNRPNNRPNYGPHPDAERLKQRRKQYETAIKNLADWMATPFDREQERRGGNPRPNPRSKPAVCPSCKTLYPQRKGNFTPNAVKCIKCNDSYGKRTCITCGVQYVGVVEHFKRSGRLHRECNACGEAKVRAKIKERVAEREAIRQRQRAKDQETP